MNKTFIAVTVVLLLSSQAHAKIAAAPSIEWLSCKSEVIVVGKIKDIAITKGPGSVIYEDCTIQVHEVLKGGIEGRNLTFCLRTLTSRPTAKDFMNPKGGVLFFLAKSKDNGPEHRLDDQYVPVSMRYPLSIFDLSNLPGDVYGRDGTILKDKKVVLDLVRTWSRSDIAHYVLSEVSPGSPTWGQLYAGSGCYLIVPAEEKYRAEFLEMARSDKPRERQKAASELYKFPGEETTRVLRDLLNDDTENFWYFSEDTITRVEFGVRAAAYRSLRALGEPVPDDIQLEREPTEAEQRSARQSCWGKSFHKGLPQGWDVISVEDGVARRVGKRNTVAVIVSCSKGELKCRFMLIPKEWHKEDVPAWEYLGINGQNNQGARHFWFSGSMPRDEKEKVVRYFGLGG